MYVFLSEHFNTGKGGNRQFHYWNKFDFGFGTSIQNCFRDITNGTAIFWKGRSMTTREQDVAWRSKDEKGRRARRGDRKQRGEQEGGGMCKEEDRKVHRGTRKEEE